MTKITTQTYDRYIAKISSELAIDTKPKYSKPQIPFCIELVELNKQYYNVISIACIQPINNKNCHIVFSIFNQ
jgi:hypothetical protein